MQSKLTYEQELYLRNLKVNIEEILSKPEKIDRVINYFSNTEEYEVCTDLAEIKNAIEENAS